MVAVGTNAELMNGRKRIGVGERARAVRGLRGKTGNHSDPRQRQGEQDQDAGDRQPRQHSRPRAEAHQEGDEHDDHERDQIGDQRGQHLRPQHRRPCDRHGMESLEDAALHVQEEPESHVGDARSDRDEQNAGQQVAHIRTCP
jgi:hypothetical protein